MRWWGACSLLLVLCLVPVPAGHTAEREGQTIGGQTDTWSVRDMGGELQIAYGSGDEWPQYAALHLGDSYFRLNYGPPSGWGTSLMLLPALWSGGTYHHGAPVTATWQVDGPDLALSISGTIASLEVGIDLTLYPPAEGRVQARIAAQVTGTVPLDDRPGEAFKPAFLSSMHISATEWDTQGAYAGCERFALPDSGWIVSPTPPVTATALGLLGGTSDWKAHAPAIQLHLDQPLQVAGWVTPSVDPNDDNVGLWAASDRILASWAYTVTASPAEGIWCTFVPLAQRDHGGDIKSVPW